MKAFIVLACLALAVSGEQSSFSSFSSHGASYSHGHAPAPRHPKPAPQYPTPPPPPKYPTPAPPPKYPAPAPAHYNPAPQYHRPAAYAPYKPQYPQPSYGYEQPKHNCSIQDEIKTGEVCTPTFETACESVSLPIKRVVDRQYCYTSTRTVCSETVEQIPNEICSYTYQKRYAEATAKSVEVSFVKESNVQMVTVCQPGYGHGYQAYGHQYCKEVAQETTYNVPVVSPVNVPVKVAFPEPIKTCVSKPISLPRISCNDVKEEKCITVPDVQDSVQTAEKCSTKVSVPACQKIELTLPKQVCIELVYGYAHDTHEKKPYA